MPLKIKTLWTLLPALIIILMPPLASAAETRSVQDSNGQTVIIPARVERVAPTIPAFAQMTEMLTRGGGKISAAYTRALSPYFKEVFPDYVRSNPRDYDCSSIEDLVAARTQVVFGPASRYSADQLKQLSALGIPFVALDKIRTVEGMCESYLTIGQILGEEEAARAREFVDYYRGNLAEATRRTADVPEKERVRILSLFFAGGTLTTINQNDVCDEYIRSAGGLNVATDYMRMAHGRMNIDLEAIVAWDPQVIMVNSLEALDELMAQPSLAGVSAVKNKRVHKCPYGIFLWSVRSGEAAMLPLWLGKIMYPERFADVDMNRVVTDFFREYYKHQLSPEGAERVLTGYNQPRESEQAR
jgi:ABC-type Fe3+-hydroxamate transport system, periplasmic component